MSSTPLAKSVTRTRHRSRSNMKLSIDTKLEHRDGSSEKSLLATPKASGLPTVLFARKKSMHVPRELLTSALAEEEGGRDDSAAVLATICHQATKDGKPASPASRHDALASPSKSKSRSTLTSPDAKRSKKGDLIDRLITKFTTAFSTMGGDEPTEGGVVEIESDEDVDNRLGFGRAQTPPKYLIPRQIPQHVGKKTLVLDLDETLVHSSFKPTRKADFIMPIIIEGSRHRVFVHKRPYLEEFLERMSKVYELVLFTASLPVYANPLCDIIDDKKFMTHRLYRQHCTYDDGCYVKDLSMLGRKMSDVLLVDNAEYSYGFQPENGFSSLTWLDDKHCTELMEMADYLEKIHDAPDLRMYTREWNSFPKKY